MQRRAMLIGIDARFALRERRGIGNYSLHLIRCLADASDANRYVLYTDVADTTGILPRKSNFRIKKLTSSNYIIWEQILLPLQAKKDNIDILHCLANTAPIYFHYGLKLISTIHDVSYLMPFSIMPRSPYIYQRLGRIYRKNIVPRSIKRASSIITVSRFAKKDILSNIPFLTEEKISIIYEAMSGVFRVTDKGFARSFVKEKYNISGKYVLNVGGRDPQKNTAFLVKNFLALKKAGAISEKLVIVGFSDYADIDQCIVNSGIADEVIFIDFAEENELVHLYNAAEIFIFPSLYESFGIPPLEAMACGTPVIASNTGAIPEIVGEAAMLINPRGNEEFKAAISVLLDDHILRQELIRRGLERVKKYSWVKMVRETLNVYETLRVTTQTSI